MNVLLILIPVNTSAIIQMEGITAPARQDTSCMTNTTVKV